MKKKILIISALTISITIIILVIYAISYFNYKEYNSSIVDTGKLYEPVEVFVDSFGVPHIFANNNHDLFFVLGWLHAKDRLFQIDMNIRASLGRLSEAFGKKTLDIDKFSRIIGFYRIGRKIYRDLDDESRAVLDAYVDGVNTFIEQAGDNLPIEFKILRYKPIKLHPEFCLAYLRTIGWTLSPSWSIEPSLFILSKFYSRDRIEDLLNLYSDKWPITITNPETDKKLTEGIKNFLEYSDNFRKTIKIGGVTSGSNNWAVSGKKTVDGYPILCNDPHLGYSQPSIWYEVHLVSPDFDVYGVSFPGLPGTVIGRNRFIAWGLTNMMLDDVDFYREKLGPDGNYYLHNGNWYRITTIREIIPVRGRKSDQIEIKLTIHGPIINDINEALEETKEALSIKWTGFDISNEIKAMLQINRAKNFKEFVSGASLFKIPGQNAAYADIYGNIALVPMGGIPRRNPGNYILPVPGNDPYYDWDNYIPFEEIPYEFNPPSNFVASANAKIFDDRFKYYISAHYEPPYRLMRIRQFLSDSRKFNIDDMKKLQLDVKSLFAQDFLDIFFSMVKEEDINENYLQPYKMLKNWDYLEKTNSIEATIFNFFLIKIIENIYKDEMDLAGEKIFDKFLSYTNFSIRNSYLLIKKGNSKWFDDINTKGKIETAQDILIKSFEEAVDCLRNNYGKSIDQWAWGNIHQLRLTHPIGENWFLNWLFKLNIGNFPAPGSQNTVNCGAYEIQNPQTDSIGPSVRFIFPFDDVETVYSVIPGGQSGNPKSNNYADQIELYLTGKYKKETIDKLTIIRKCKNSMLFR